jgi:hypothetical protein
MLLGVDGECCAESITGIIGFLGSSSGLVGRRNGLPLLAACFNSDD